MIGRLVVHHLDDSGREEMALLFGSNWEAEFERQIPTWHTQLTLSGAIISDPYKMTLFNEEDEGFDAKTHCPMAECSVAAVIASRRTFENLDLEIAHRISALLSLIYYTVQLHIPTNTGFFRDQGGRRLFIKNKSDQPVSIMWIWNYGLYRELEADSYNYAQKLFDQTTNRNKENWQELSETDWAYEGHEIAKEQVYPLALNGKYDSSFIKTGQEILAIQLSKAGFRIAELINEVGRNKKE